MRDALVQAALLGTATRGAPPAGGAADALAAAATTSNERRLLLAAGVDAVRFRAGASPQKAPAAPEPCPDDARPECPRPGASVIDEIVSSGDVDLVIETARRLADIERRIPSQQIPAVLSMPKHFAARREELVEALRPVLGERGRWIARFAGNQWAWGADDSDGGAPGAADEKTWAEGATAQRAAVLAKRRRTTPDVAREWLSAAWKQERAEERAAFLETYATGLSLADEAFLEAALDDRSAGVRAATARLLAMLPGSAFGKRAEERAASMLVWTSAAKLSMWEKLRGVKHAPTLDAKPPAAIPEEWERDGLVGKPPEGIGERAFRLAQALALVPPSHWCERFASPPDALVAAVAQSEWRTGTLLGWSRAAVAFADPRWARELWDVWPVHHEMREEILRVMDRDAAELAVASLFEVESSSGFAFRFARAMARPWGMPLAAAALDAVRAGHMSRASPPASNAHNADALADLAPAFPLSILEDAIRLAVSFELEGAAARRRDALVHRLRLRQRIHQEIVP